MQPIVTRSNRVSRAPASRAGLALLALLFAAPPIHAEATASEEAKSGPRIVGTWIASVTLRNCDTGAALGPPHVSLTTYHADGTISESTGSLAFAPNQRSDGHGVWKQLGAGVFSQRIIGLMRYATEPNPPAPGFEAGLQVIDHTLTLIDRDHSISEGIAQLFDREGELYFTGCTTVEAVRFR